MEQIKKICSKSSADQNRLEYLFITWNSVARYFSINILKIYSSLSLVSHGFFLICPAYFFFFLDFFLIYFFFMFGVSCISWIFRFISFSIVRTFSAISVFSIVFVVFYYLQVHWLFSLWFSFWIEPTQWPFLSFHFFSCKFAIWFKFITFFYLLRFYFSISFSSFLC